MLRSSEIVLTQFVIAKPCATGFRKC